MIKNCVGKKVSPKIKAMELLYSAIELKAEYWEEDIYTVEDLTDKERRLIDEQLQKLCNAFYKRYEKTIKKTVEEK